MKASIFSKRNVWQSNISQRSRQYTQLGSKSDSVSNLNKTTKMGNRSKTNNTPIDGDLAVNASLSYAEIELSISKFYGTRQHIIVPNCYINFGTIADHECDLIVIKRSGYAVEIEIKMSKSDLKADFKKKHGHIDDRLQHLFYALPSDLYEKCKELIPEYAGIMVVYPHETGAYTRILKPAPVKPCRKLTVDEQLKIARLGVMRVWNLKKKLITGSAN